MLPEDQPQQEDHRKVDLRGLQAHRQQAHQCVHQAPGGIRRQLMTPIEVRGGGGLLRKARQCPTANVASYQRDFNLFSETFGRDSATRISTIIFLLKTFDLCPM